jgi:hypothetical protein
MEQNVTRSIIGFGVRIMAAASLPLLMAAGKPAEPIRWSGTDLGGQQVVVPAAGKPTVMVFIRPGQSQSGQLLRELRGLLGNDSRSNVEDPQVVVVVSGPQAAEQARSLGEAAAGWSIVADPDYDLSGRTSVHVWPMTVLLNAEGDERARLGGLPRSYTADLQAHLEHAAGQIDQETLDERLTTRRVVVDENGPAKRLQVAEQLLHRGHSEQAREALREAVDQIGDDPAAQVRAARMLTMLQEPAEAIAMLDRIPVDRLPPWQIHIVRARALVQLGEWEQARKLLPEAMKLNPNPGEVHYLQGLLHQHEANWQSAADSFRQAFESTAPAQKLAAQE